MVNVGLDARSGSALYIRRTPVVLPSYVGGAGVIFILCPDKIYMIKTYFGSICIQIKLL
jgi:hypothetical protein